MPETVLNYSVHFLRLISGLEEITSGELYIGDRLVNNVDAKDRDIAMVFQSYALYPHLSAYDNIAFGLKVKKTEKSIIRGKVEEALKLGNSRVFNIIVLGVAAKHMDFSKEAWLNVIEKTVPPKTVEINKKAFLLGFEGQYE